MISKEELIAAIEEGCSTRKLAEKFECGQTSIRYWLKKYGLKTKPLIRAHPRCLFCGKELDRSVSKYCNGNCHHAHEYQKRVLKVKRTGNVHDGFKTQPAMKKYLVDIRSHQCEICGNTEWMGQMIPLVLDHIDGDSKNNMETNLRLVCSNCNMLLRYIYANKRSQ